LPSSSAPFLADFHWSREKVSIMVSVNIFLYRFPAPAAGILADR